MQKIEIQTFYESINIGKKSLEKTLLEMRWYVKFLLEVVIFTQLC